MYAQTDDDGEDLYSCANCDGATRVTRLCPKVLPDIEEFEFWNKIEFPNGSWASRRKWLLAHIKERETIVPETGQMAWSQTREDHAYSYTLLSLLNGREFDESEGLIWPDHIDPLRTCPVLLIDPEVDALMQHVVYIGDNQIMPWCDGGLSQQPLWWVDTMHAIKKGVGKLYEQMRETKTDA